MDFSKRGDPEAEDKPKTPTSAPSFSALKYTPKKHTLNTRVKERLTDDELYEELRGKMRESYLRNRERKLEAARRAYDERRNHKLFEEQAVEEAELIEDLKTQKRYDVKARYNFAVYGIPCKRCGQPRPHECPKSGR